MPTDMTAIYTSTHTNSVNIKYVISSLFIKIKIHTTKRIKKFTILNTSNTYTLNCDVINTVY